MRRKRTQVPEEVVKRWVYLRRAGWPYARIAREAGIDRRIVARLVEAYEAQEMKQATVSARQEVASRLLEEHFRDLEAAATTLLRIVLPPSLRDSLYLEPPQVAGMLEEHLMGWYLSRQAYPPGAGPDGLDRRRAARQAQALVAALREHQPQLWSLAEKWTGQAAEYHRRWLALEGRAAATGISVSAARSDLEQALRRPKGGKDLAESGPPARDGSAQPGEHEVAGWLSGDEVLGGLRELLEQMERMENIFLAIEDLLDPAPLRRALLSTRCRLCPV